MTSAEFREKENIYLESVRLTIPVEDDHHAEHVDDQLDGPAQFDQLDNEGVPELGDNSGDQNIDNTQELEEGDDKDSDEGIDDEDEDEKFERELGFGDDEALGRNSKIRTAKTELASNTNRLEASGVSRSRSNSHRVNPRQQRRRAHSGGRSSRNFRFRSQVQQRRQTGRRHGRRTSRGSRERRGHMTRVRRRHGYGNNNNMYRNQRGRVGAVDSREMAAMGDRRRTGVLDSREMAGVMDSREMATSYVMRDTPARRRGRRRWSRRNY